MKLDVQELIKSINEDVKLMSNLGEITEDNLKQLLNHLCDVYDKSAVIKVLKSRLETESVENEVTKENKVESYGLIEDIDEENENSIQEKVLNFEEKIDAISDVAEKAVDNFEERIDAEVEELLNEADQELDVDALIDETIKEVEDEVGIAGHSPKEAWEHKVSLHEKIAKEKEDVSLAVKLQQKPISDLSKAMGLNEKVLFANELFGGSKDEFDSHVSILNSMQSFEDAKEYLDSKIIPTYNWKGDDAAATHFITLLQRRFINA